MSEGYEALLRVRVSAADAHYAGGLVAGSWIVGIFGDIATELCVENDGDEGLMRAYDNIEFLAPLRAGDFVEARGRLTAIGKTSRAFACEARKVGELDLGRDTTAAHLLSDSLLVARASGTVVIP
jgi:acyl-CoA hydrolase